MFARWSKKDGNGRFKFDKQTDLVNQALSHAGQPLNELLRLMHQESEGSLYLAGKRLDSSYCFGSKELGLVISSLPDDGKKAAEPGYHPGSTEVYIVFQGELVIELLNGDKVDRLTCHQFDVHVIQPGTCHRVRFDPKRAAASLIVKTNLKFEPEVIRCRSCTYFDRPEICQLHQSWLLENK